MDKITFKFKPDYIRFVNVNRIMSPEWAHFILWLGGRGIGKTTGMGFYVLNDFMNNGNEFVYCRRYVEEMKYAKDFITPIANGVKMKSMGKALIQYQNNGVRIGYGLALSAQQKFKSGVDFSKVKTLIFDEAILASGARYLPNEIEAYALELISTIFRNRTDYKVIIMGNNANIFNPYFEYFNIPNFDNKYSDRERGLYCEKSRNSPALLELEKKTPLFNLTKGTNYGDYHYNNAALVLFEGRIGDKPYDSELLVRLCFEKRTLNIYYSEMTKIGNFKGAIFVELRNKEIDDKYTFNICENSNLNYLGKKRFVKSDAYTILESCFYEDNIIYENNECVAILNTIMDML